MVSTDANWQPDDLLVQPWTWGRSAALDVTVTTALPPNFVKNGPELSGHTTEAAEDQK